LIVLASGLPSIQFRPGKSLNLIAWLLSELVPDSQSDSPDVIRRTQSDLLPEVGDVLLKSMIVAFWLMLILSILVFVVSPRFRRELLRTIAMIIPLVILLPQIAKLMTQQSDLSEAEGVGGYFLGDTAFPQAPDYVQNPPEWLFLLVNFALLFLILLVAFFLWRRFRPKPDTQAVVVKEVRRALSNLDSGLDFKDVVIACYAQMCQKLQESQQIKRHRAMTPREFEEHLSNAGIASIHIQQLTRLFEGVRYGAKSSDAATQNEAKLCLQSILEVYGDS
jgi:hypothetical protein